MNHNQRKPTHSKDHPTQPKINKYIKKNFYKKKRTETREYTVRSLGWKFNSKLKKEKKEEEEAKGGVGKRREKPFSDSGKQKGQ